MRWTLLTQRRNWNANDWRRMRDLMGSGLSTLRAFLLVENFEHFWTYTSSTWAGKFLDSEPISLVKSLSFTHLETSRNSTHPLIL
jgi:transposase